tara:strand:- start:45 stop:767 length:723 start_codon:yes stop_codon:yes gene_type:complete
MQGVILGLLVIMIILLIGGVLYHVATWSSRDLLRYEDVDPNEGFFAREKRVHSVMRSYEEATWINGQPYAKGSELDALEQAILYIDFLTKDGTDDETFFRYLSDIGGALSYAELPLEKMNEELVFMERELEKIEESRDELEQQIKALEEERGELKQELLDGESPIEDAGDVANINELIAPLTQQLESKRKTLADIEQDLQSQMDERNDQEREIHRAETLIYDANEMVSDYEQALQTWKDS